MTDANIDNIINQCIDQVTSCDLNVDLLIAAAASVDHDITGKGKGTLRTTRSCRDKSKLKVVAEFASPYVDRKIDTRSNLNRTEKALALFTIYNTEADPDFEVFRYRDVVLRRNELQTMAVGELINVNVIDVWTIMLNRAESIRSEGSPHRYFFTTDLCLQTIVSTPSNWSDVRIPQTFCDKLEDEYAKFAVDTLDKIDMLFFPILNHGHYYFICIDVVKRCVAIVDSKNYSEEDIFLDKYNDIVRKLLVVFFEHVKKLGYGWRYYDTNDFDIKVEAMDWVDTTNSTDCGIYLMRHMEAYTGRTKKKWSYGLSKRSKKQLKVLILRYCASIVGWEHNDYRDANITEANEFFQLMNSDPNFNIDKQLKLV